MVRTSMILVLLLLFCTTLAMADRLVITYASGEEQVVELNRGVGEVRRLEIERDGDREGKVEQRKQPVTVPPKQPGEPHIGWGSPIIE
ncbi:MAG TPA: hypothetical protein VFR01_05595 [Geobacterales bacterium]|nr:hypothetical protein [Geobacterales bacterium]